MTARHTPGPWTAYAADAKGGTEYSIHGRGCFVASVLPQQNSAANARLIASAPALLAALESIGNGPCFCEEPEPGEVGTVKCDRCVARAAMDAARGGEGGRDA